MRFAATALVALLSLAAVPSPGPGPDLDQRVDAGQAVTAGHKELTAGHVDIGPRYRDGEWTVLVHDDTAVPPVWRPLSDVVLRVPDAAVQQVPADPAYAFLGREPGDRVHVIPQTQDQQVVWVGWNTQDPGVMDAIARGVTMSLLGVEGPGGMVVFLQNGDLGAPTVLWDTAKPYPQPVWVETNTHTHANWVFTAPGVYLALVELSADLAGGGTLSAREVVRFAVGDATPTADAFAAALSAPAAPGASTPPAAAAPDDGGNALLGALIAVAAAVLVAGLVWAGVRARRVRREAAR